MEENIVKVPNLNIKPIEVKNCYHCKHCIDLCYTERQDAYDVLQSELICNKNKKFEVELKDGDFYKTINKHKKNMIDCCNDFDKGNKNFPDGYELIGFDRIERIKQ